MKNNIKVIGLLITFLFYSCSSEDQNSNENQNIFEGDVFLKIQEDVDEFGLNNYTGINGNLTIGFQDIVGSIVSDLTPLSSLTFVNGDVTITGTTSASGGFNEDLTTLLGLNNIQEIGGAFKISNIGISNFGGLNSLTKIDGSLSIVGCSNLLEINGLSNLSTLNGDLSIGFYFGAGSTGNENLINIDGLSSLSAIGGNLQLSGNQSLENISGLQNINQLPLSLDIHHNDSLTNIEGLNSLTSIGEDVFISFNQELINVDSMSNLQSIGGNLEIASNYNLNQINGFNSLIGIEGNLSLSYNNDITNINEAFSSLQTVTGGIFISESNIINLNGFTNLTSAEIVSITNNDNLNQINGFNNITTLNTGGLMIENNNSLNQINGFNSLTSVFNLYIIGDFGSSPNNQIESIEGLISLSNIDFDFEIKFTSIQNLNFLTNMANIGNNFIVKDNYSLNDFCGINSLINNDGVSGEYAVFFNLYNPTQQDIIDGNCSQ